MEYTLRKGGKVSYITNFLPEDFTRDLWRELKGTEIYTEKTLIKNKEIDVIFAKSQSGVLWKQAMTDYYGGLVSYP